MISQNLSITTSKLFEPVGAQLSVNQSLSRGRYKGVSQRCCQTKEPKHQYSFDGYVYEVTKERHSVRAASRFSLNVLRFEGAVRLTSPSISIHLMSISMRSLKSATRWEQRHGLVWMYYVLRGCCQTNANSSLFDQSSGSSILQEARSIRLKRRCGFA